MKNQEHVAAILAAPAVVAALEAGLGVTVIVGPLDAPGVAVASQPNISVAQLADMLGRLRAEVAREAAMIEIRETKAKRRH